MAERPRFDIPQLGWLMSPDYSVPYIGEPDGVVRRVKGLLYMKYLCEEKHKHHDSKHFVMMLKEYLAAVFLKELRREPRGKYPDESSEEFKFFCWYMMEQFTFEDRYGGYCREAREELEKKKYTTQSPTWSSKPYLLLAQLVGSNENARFNLLGGCSNAKALAEMDQLREIIRLETKRWVDQMFAPEVPLKIDDSDDCGFTITAVARHPTPPRYRR